VVGSFSVILLNKVRSGSLKCSPTWVRMNTVIQWLFSSMTALRV